MNPDYCMCNLHSHLAIKQELQGQLGDKLTVDMQSDIEKSLEDRLKDFDIDIENPNFTSPNAEIDIRHITDKTINAKIKRCKTNITMFSPRVNSMWVTVT